MAHGKPHDPRKEQHWQRRIQLWKNSGLTVRDFCARHHLAQPSFYAWRRELQQRDAATTFVPVRVVPDDQPTPATPIEVVLARGGCVRATPGFDPATFTPGFDPATLRQLLAGLQEAPSC